MIDRRWNRNASTGQFELIFKSPVVSSPNYHGIELKVDGNAYKKPSQSMEKKIESKPEPIDKEPKELPVLKSNNEKLAKLEYALDKIQDVKVSSSSPATTSTTRLVDNIVTTLNTDKSRTIPSMPSVFNENKLEARKTLNPSSVSVQVKPKKELQAAPISIATSIHELANKGKFYYVCFVLKDL